MIINTGGRTDTVQYYTDWLFRRFEEGYALSRNPLFPHRITRYELTPDKVDCVLFCSKNYRPALSRLRGITASFNTYFHYTITAYGKDLEPGVPPIKESVDTLIALSELVGGRRVAWRYDPVLLTGDYTIRRHLETFERLAKVLAPHIDRCIFSFVEMYRKVELNMPEIVPFSVDAMDSLARGLGAIAARHGVSLQTAAPAATIRATAYARPPVRRWRCWAGPTVWRSGPCGTRGCGGAAIASKAGISARTTPAPMAAPTVMPTKIPGKPLRTSAVTTRSRRC